MLDKNKFEIELLRAGKTRGAVASQLNIDTNTMRNWLNGTVVPTVGKIVDLANAIGCLATDLVQNPEQFQAAQNLRIYGMKLTDGRITGTVTAHIVVEERGAVYVQIGDHRFMMIL